jgi:hypothetical protein
LGKVKQIDSVQVIWPGGKYQVIKNVKTNKVYTYKIADAKLQYDFTKKPVKTLFVETEKTFVRFGTLNIPKMVLLILITSA